MVIRNSAAHFAARIVSLAAGLAAIPLISLTLGAEALGLLGVHLTLQGFFGLFELGLSVAVNQQLAIAISRKHTPVKRAELVRSLEAVFWLMTLVFITAGWLAKGAIIHGWLRVDSIPKDVLDTALTYIVIGAALRFPIPFYANVMYGLDRHIYPSIVIMLAALMRIICPVVALVSFSAGITTYFLILLTLNAFEVVLLLLGAWRRLGHVFAAPRWERLREISHAATALSLLSMVLVVASQIDKVILSNQLTLSEFGVYAAAFALASGFLALSYPVSNALFPQMVRQLDSGDNAGAARTVLDGTGLVSLLLIPIGAVIIFQPAAVLDLLFLFRTPPEGFGHILPLIMVGALAQSFVTLPHMFQIAAVRTPTLVRFYSLLLLPFAVAIYLAARVYGITGAAIVFSAYNVVQLLGMWGMLTANARYAAIWRPVVPKVLTVLLTGAAIAWLMSFVPAQYPLDFVLAAGTSVVIAVVIVLLLPGMRGKIADMVSCGFAK